MNLLGKLFGSEEAIKASAIAIKDSIDVLVYTDEEKAQDAAKERSEARSMIVEWMAATQGQNLARRLIALTMTGIWALQYLGYISLSIAAIWVEDPNRVNEAANLLFAGADQMSGAMMLILGFYFSAPFMDRIVDSAMSKFSNKRV